MIINYREADGERSVYVVVNLANKEENVDLSTLVGLSKKLTIYYATTNANFLIG